MRNLCLYQGKSVIFKMFIFNMEDNVCVCVCTYSAEWPQFSALGYSTHSKPLTGLHCTVQQDTNNSGQPQQQLFNKQSRFALIPLYVCGVWKTKINLVTSINISPCTVVRIMYISNCQASYVACCYLNCYNWSAHTGSGC